MRIDTIFLNPRLSTKGSKNIFTFVVVVDSTAAVVAAVLGSYDEILVDQPAVPPREVVNSIF